MEIVKRKEQFFEPDPRSRSLGPPLDNQYEMLSYFRLHDGVPDSIRSYMNSIVTLWLYGWFYYPFYTIVIFSVQLRWKWLYRNDFLKSVARG